MCVPRCQRDPQFCAQQVNDYLTAGAGDKFRFQDWPLFPGVEPLHGNTATPMHGAFLTITVNDVAKKYLDDVLASGAPAGKISFPNGSLIVKQNFTLVGEDPESKPWLTVMWKLDGYCHAGFSGAGACTGGDWFWYLYRFDRFLQFNKVPVVGKAQAFCIDCHGPVQKADFSWQLFNQLKARLPSTSTVPAEQPATSNVAEFCDDIPIVPVLPGDVALNPEDAKKKFGPEKTQLMFDCLSWRSFTALNWPAEPGKRGAPDKSREISDTGERVWESYREIFEIFQPDDPDWTLNDKSWNSPGHFDPVCNQRPGDKVMRMRAKQRNSQIVNETHQAFGNQFNILVDQNGNMTHFEVRVNRDEYEFFKKNGYADTGAYDVGGPLGQLDWSTDPLHFPDNIRGTEGAIEIKAAWREMCFGDNCKKQDNRDKYYVREALVYTPAPDGTAGSCRPVEVGLVGLHIGHKTFWSPQWVWSTFEHVENVPKVNESSADQTDGQAPYSYFDPDTARRQPSNADCRVQRPGVIPNTHSRWYRKNADACPNLQLIANSHPPPASQADQAPMQNDDRLTPNQVTRIDPVTKSPLNDAYRNKLGSMGSVFQYFELVNTQWPLNGRGTPSETTINMNPCDGDESGDCYRIMPPDSRLRNTTMETFQVAYEEHQDKSLSQFSSAGCMQCHAGAGLDFSFAWTDGAEEVVQIHQTDLDSPPRGSYQQSCYAFNMDGTQLQARCSRFDGTAQNAQLNDAHSCTGDIGNINGELLCNPPVGSFTLTCNSIDINDNVLSAECLKGDTETRVQSSLNVDGYHGVVSNCDGELTRGRCSY
ncbi:MAG: CVNH domain-containing protein [Wenzhouxiangellaceae bacterium]